MFIYGISIYILPCIGGRSGGSLMTGLPGAEEDALEAALGLGELAGLTINNDADIPYDVSANNIYSMLNHIKLYDFEVH
jgi:hypothetical protein